VQLDAFLERLEGVHKNAGGWIARCPAHEDREPSLGITEGSDGILLQCYAGCATKDVLAALGLEWRDLFFNTVNYAEPEATYDYVDEQGELLFQAIRFPNKRFRQKHTDPETGEDVWNLDGVRRVLYKLPLVIQAVRNGQTIWVCEGEKDAEALIAAGKMATCNPMGAGKWRPEYAQYLSGARVTIVADRDEPGRAHAETVKQSLEGIAEAIYIVQAKQGKDAYDHLVIHGLPLEEFQPLKQRVRRGIITSRELAEQGEEDLNLTEADLPGYQLIEALPLVFRQGRMYAAGAYQGDGKSRFALQGTRKLASEGKRGGYWSLEMPERDVRNALLTHKGIPLALLEEPWRLRSDAAMRSAYLDGLEEIRSWNVDFVCKSSVSAAEIAQEAMDREHEFVFVDHIHRLPTRDRAHLEAEVKALTNMALEQNLMLVVLCQLRKHMRGKDQVVYPIPTLNEFRETSQIADDASMALAIWRQRDDSGMRYTGSTQVIVLKNRHTTGANDATGKFFFPKFDPVRQMLIASGLEPGAVIQYEGQPPTADEWSFA
jgi:replicative DNA helicase